MYAVQKVNNTKGVAMHGGEERSWFHADSRLEIVNLLFLFVN